jgi:hypothetical protein
MNKKGEFIYTKINNLVELWLKKNKREACLEKLVNSIDLKSVVLGLDGSSPSVGILDSVKAAHEIHDLIV